MRPEAATARDRCRALGDTALGTVAKRAGAAGEARTAGAKAVCAQPCPAPPAAAQEPRRSLLGAKKRKPLSPAPPLQSVPKSNAEPGIQSALYKCWCHFPIHSLLHPQPHYSLVLIRFLSFSPPPTHSYSYFMVSVSVPSLSSSLPPSYFLPSCICLRFLPLSSLSLLLSLRISVASLLSRGSLPLSLHLCVSRLSFSAFTFFSAPFH